MTALLAHTPTFAAMFVLMVASAMFSASEAAFFSLSREDRRRLAERGRLGNLAAGLCEHPERLLHSILFGNLIVNLLAFTLSAWIAFRLHASGHSELAGLVAVCSLVVVILFCEILPKDLAVLAPQFVAVVFVLPISFVIQLLRPIFPLLNTINVLSRRLFWPNFEPEARLHIGDLEKAVELSRNDASLLKREQRVLQNIVSLSELCAEELMWPRALLKVFKPPVSFEHITEEFQGKLPPGGFLLISEPGSDEISSAVSLIRRADVLRETIWQSDSEPIHYIPWSVSVAVAFEQLCRNQKEIAAVLNEFGETIGVLTIDDILRTLFTREQGRSRRLLDRFEIERFGQNCWRVNSLTGLRQLKRKFGVVLPAHSSVTVGGLLHEVLERLPHQGDVCRFGPFEFSVIEVTIADDPVIELRFEEV